MEAYWRAAMTLLVRAVVAGILLLVTATASAPPVAAQDADFGKQIWLTKVNCRDCHGWSGNGLADNPQAPSGPNLRATALTPDQIAEVIRCGRPGTPMPYFDQFAYTDRRCYGMTAADMGDKIPGPGAKTLIKREVDALVALIESTFIGKGPPTYEECRAFWGANSTQCDRYPKAN